jgi:hypothetical protein
VAKVGKSNPDRTISLKGCSKLIIIIIIIIVRQYRSKEIITLEDSLSIHLERSSSCPG